MEISRARPSVFVSATQSKVALVWAKRTSALYGRLCTNVLRKVCQCLSRLPLLAMCTFIEIFVFDPLDEKLRRTNILHAGVPFRCNFYPECVCIDNSQFFICGGAGSINRENYTTTDTWVIDADRVIQRNLMQTARHSHGLYYNEAAALVYAFAGIDRASCSISSCEQYNLRTQRWSPLPNMIEAKSHLCISAHQGKVYICGKYAKHCEVFTMATNLFALLSIEVTVSGGFNSLFVWNSQIILLQEVNAWKFDLNSCNLIEKLKIEKGILTRNIVVVNDVIYYLDTRMHIGKCYLNTMAISKLSDLPQANLQN